MQIVSLEDKLHKMSKPIFWENTKSSTSFSSAEKKYRRNCMFMICCDNFLQICRHFMDKYKR